jgi:hypothetical protein
MLRSPVDEIWFRCCENLQACNSFAMSKPSNRPPLEALGELGGGRLLVVQVTSEVRQLVQASGNATDGK